MAFSLHLAVAGETITATVYNQATYYNDLAIGGTDGKIGVSAPAVHVTHTIAQNVTSGVLLALEFDTERYDTDGMHDAGSNTRLTCQVAGKYLIKAQVRFSSNSNGYRYAQLRLNGATEIGQVAIGANPSEDTVIVTSTIKDLAVADYVEVVAYQNSGSTLQVEKAADSSPEFMAIRIA